MNNQDKPSSRDNHKNNVAVIIVMIFLYVMVFAYLFKHIYYNLMNYKEFYYLKETAKVELYDKYGPGVEITGYDIEWSKEFLFPDQHAISEICFFATTSDQKEVSILMD